MSEEPAVLTERRGGVLVITLNRPAVRNCLNSAASAELYEIFDCYFADPELWVAIITGAGDTAFCAGADLRELGGGRPVSLPLGGFGGLTSRRRMYKPVIAAVNGYAFGGGCEISLACHLVVADETASFALSEVRVGVVAGAGGVARLQRIVPPKVANEMILTARRVPADAALELGLVNRVVPAGHALSGARELAAEILEGSPTSVRLSLQMMDEADGTVDTIDAVVHPSPALDELMLSADAVEGRTAFAEKRRPRWRNC